MKTNSRWKISSIRRRLEALTPYQKWKFIYTCGDKATSLIGINVFSDCTWSWRTPIGGITILSVYIAEIYSLWFYWHENKITAIQPFTIMAMSVQALVMFYRVVGPSRFEFRSLLQFSGRKIYVNRAPSDEYEKVLDGNASKLIKVTIVALLVVILSFNMILIGPTYAFMFHGEYNTVSGGVLPFTDLETYNGFIINLIIQSAFGFSAFAANIAIEVQNCLIINTCTAMSDLACCSMRKFSANLVSGTFDYQNKAELRDVFVRLQDLENYIRQFNDLYYWKLFLQPILTTACVSLGIFAQVENGWVSGYGFALCTYLSLLVLCYMGNSVQVTCENIEAGFHNIDWISVPPTYRKQLTQVLHRWQNPPTLTIGPFEQLNYETASNLTKRIYSVLMLFFTYMGN